MGLQDTYFERAGVKSRDASLSPTLTLTPNPRERNRRRSKSNSPRRSKTGKTEVPPRDDLSEDDDKQDEAPGATAVGGRLPSVSFSPSE